MENISPTAKVPVPDELTTCSTASPSSSPRSLPLLQQASNSDSSIVRNSIGSSSDFNVRQIPRTDRSLAPVTEKSQSNSSSSGGNPLASNDLGTLNGTDPLSELPPREQWMPAEVVLKSNNTPVDPDDNLTIGVRENNEEADESSRRVTFDNPVSTAIDEVSTARYEGFGVPAPSNLSNASSIYSTAPSFKGSPNLGPEENEDTYLLNRIVELIGKDQEAFDLSKINRARLYEYYICRVRKLKVLCDQGHDMRDLPVHSEEDYALLRTLTRTNWGTRWWTIMTEDLICPECVSLLKARREDPKSKCTRAWLRVKSKIRRVCLCRDNSHDFVCNHTRPDMNKVTRFFHALGRGNASRMVNIELVTNPLAPIDIDVLASAVHNAARYFTDTQRISIRLYFQEKDVMDREQIDGIVCALARLEAMLPWGHKLHVAGLDKQTKCRRVWLKKSRMRKWWKIL